MRFCSILIFIVLSFFFSCSLSRMSISSNRNVGAMILLDPMGGLSVGDEKVEEEAYIDLTLTVRKGDSLWGIVREGGVPPGLTHMAISAARSIGAPISLDIGQLVTLRLREIDGSLWPIKLTYSLDNDTDVVIDGSPNSSSFSATFLKKDTYVKLFKASGDIVTNLFDAGAKQGLDNNIIGEFTKIFNSRVNFAREISKEGKFELLYEKIFDRNGNFIRNGNILFAGLETGRRSLRGYYLKEEDSGGEYYDEDGIALKGGMFRIPVENARVTSSYGMRSHPILGGKRMHFGVDLAAPLNTVVRAAGSGIVSFVGYSASYGRYIKVNHGGDYYTLYAHLNSFVDNISPGKNVKQGDKIGFIGKSGMATGPHLHYEVIKNGRRIDPMKALSYGEPKKAVDMQRFADVKKVCDYWRLTYENFSDVEIAISTVSSGMVK